MENNRRREGCNVNVHRASMQKHLRIKKNHLENEKQMKSLYQKCYLKNKHLLKNIKKVYNL